MNQIVEKALYQWGMEGAKYELAAARENSVFKVDHAGGSAALRLHRKGYRTDAELHCELLWMQLVAERGLNVPSPIPTGSGQLMLHIDDTQVDVLTWLSGITFASAMENGDADERISLFHKLGREMALLHEYSDAWSRPTEFERAAWDIDGLLGENPLWGRFWENPHLSYEEVRLLENFRKAAADDLRLCQPELDYGLIHADLVPGNVIVSGETLKLIDFDDGGFGFRTFELATALLKYRYDEDFLSLRKALVEGYTTIRFIDLDRLDLFLAIRAVTYVGWNIERFSEIGATERNARFIKTASDLTRQYLGENT